MFIDEQGLPKWLGVSHIQQYINDFSDGTPLDEVVLSLWTDITSDAPHFLILVNRIYHTSMISLGGRIFIVMYDFQ